MENKTFSIVGIPGTYATRKEEPWKKAIYQQAPRPNLDGREIGLRMRFILLTFRPWGQPLDVDNLCEPVFSIIVDQVGWFKRARSNIQWWQATKETGSEPGCKITVHTSESVILPNSEPDYDHIYTGNLPKSARFQPMVNWSWNIRNQNHIRWIPQECSLYLNFPSSNHNIGKIRADSIVKPTIDCLYPFLGGKIGAPDDHRIISLAVSKSQVTQPKRGVTIKIWALGRDYNNQPTMPQQQTLFDSKPMNTRRRQSKPGAGSITNPCVPGTRKWIVCEGALARKTIGEVKSNLENAHRGSGNRIKEYISDLRRENSLDIRIEGELLVCYGRL